MQFKNLKASELDGRVELPGLNEWIESLNGTEAALLIAAPAGTGKTYLAMAKAVQALQTKQVNRIILTRPAVEAGERLGFLPGDMKEKVDPYLRPLYDALYDMLEADKLNSYMERGIVEVAPLAFLRQQVAPVTTRTTAQGATGLYRLTGEGDELGCSQPAAQEASRRGQVTHDDDAAEEKLKDGPQALLIVYKA